MIIFLLIFQRAKALKQMKEEGNLAFKTSDWKKAHELYSQALQIDPHNKATNAKLYFNRATVDAKLRNYQDSVADCNEAIKLDEKYLKAFLRRGRYVEYMYVVGVLHNGLKSEKR